jgi:hypothetical protein
MQKNLCYVDIICKIHIPFIRMGLKIGELSQPVETDSGIHLILRIA